MFLAQLVSATGVPETGAVLPVLIDVTESAAEALEEEALQTETLLIEIIGTLVVLFLQLPIDSAREAPHREQWPHLAHDRETAARCSP